MPKKEVVRKKFRVDPEKLERARAFLGTESDTATINKALDLVLRSAPPAEKKKPVRKQVAGVAPKTSKNVSGAGELPAVSDKRPPARNRPAFAPKARPGN